MYRIYARRKGLKIYYISKFSIKLVTKLKAKPYNSVVCYQIANLEKLSSLKTVSKGIWEYHPSWLSSQSAPYALHSLDLLHVFLQVEWYTYQLVGTSTLRSSRSVKQPWQSYWPQFYQKYHGQNYWSYTHKNQFLFYTISDNHSNPFFLKCKSSRVVFGPGISFTKFYDVVGLSRTNNYLLCFRRRILGHMPSSRSLKHSLIWNPVTLIHDNAWRKSQWLLLLYDIADGRRHKYNKTIECQLDTAWHWLIISDYTFIQLDIINWRAR